MDGVTGHLQELPPCPLSSQGAAGQAGADLDMEAARLGACLNLSGKWLRPDGVAPARALPAVAGRGGRGVRSRAHPPGRAGGSAEQAPARRSRGRRDGSPPHPPVLQRGQHTSSAASVPRAGHSGCGSRCMRVCTCAGGHTCVRVFERRLHVAKCRRTWG